MGCESAPEEMNFTGKFQKLLKTTTRTPWVSDLLKRGKKLKELDSQGLKIYVFMNSSQCIWKF